MKRNISLLKKLRTRFLRMRHPKHFYMGNVATKTECGTAMCIAGHALDLAGYKRKYVGEGCGDSGDYNWFTPSGRQVTDAMNAAQRELGLTKKEAIGGDYTPSGIFLQFDLKTPKAAAAVITKLIDSQP